MAITAAGIFIFADSRTELDEKTSNGPNVYLKYLVKDNDGEYIISDSLDLKEESDANHSLKVIQSEIDSKLSSVKTTF